MELATIAPPDLELLGVFDLPLQLKEAVEKSFGGGEASCGGERGQGTIELALHLPKVNLAQVIVKKTKLQLSFIKE